MWGDKKQEAKKVCKELVHESENMLRQSFKAKIEH